MSKNRRTNYWEFLRLEELLALQSGLAHDEHEIDKDEVLFITVHQIFELWFKLARKELVYLRDLFKQEQVAEQVLSDVVRSIKRVVTLLRQCAAHFEVVETLTTRSYLGFRDKLMPASGFQSAQLRQIEILLGLDDDERIPLGPGEDYIEALRPHEGGDSDALRRVLAQKEDRPTLREAVEEWLYRTPIDGRIPSDPDAEATVQRFITAYVRAQHDVLDETEVLALARAKSEDDRERLQAMYVEERRAIEAFLNPGPEEGGARRQRIRAACLFILSYRELPLLAWPREVLDGLIELEQLFVIFRQRHARMVERVIGRRTGTGGSSGVDYLDSTALRYRVFRDLWAVRTYQIRQAAIPPLEHEDFYRFKNE